ncbi:MAG TPA: hypothetical protein PLH39_04705 [Promineifilum sp.]|nr:hypothetical protein [Promineifilum sp.]
MITLNGSIQRHFYFPADPLTTLIYFSELSRVAFLLPHINVIETYTDSQVRIRFQTVELGAYTINIYCDLELTVDVGNNVIYIAPMTDYVPVADEATLNATTGYGFYNSTARLTPAEDDGTNIDYSFQFESKLERPRGLRMMPRRIVDRIAHSISMGRVEEIADGFMVNAAEAFADWLAAQKRTLAADWLAARNGVAPAAEPRKGS